MDNFLDLLFPLALIIGSILMSRFSKKQSQEEEESTGEEEVPDEIRNLREEIRKRVEENQRQQAPSEQAAPRKVTPVPVSPQTQVRTQSQTVSRQGEVDREARERMDRLRTMQRDVKAMQSKAEAEKKKAARVAAGRIPGEISDAIGSDISQLGKKLDMTAGLGRSRSGRRSVVGEVLKDLRDPMAARKAILNSEIIGVPVGLRKGQGQALWET